MSISVIATIYNQNQRYIHDCIESIYSQTIKKDLLEVILIDDHSYKSETKLAIQELQKKYSDLKVITNKENIGPNLSREKALEFASGKYIFYIDGDDILTRDALETLRIVALTTNSEITSGLFYRYNGTSISYNKIEREPYITAKNRLQRLQLTTSMQLGGFSMCNSLIEKKLLTSDIFESDKRLLHEDMTTSFRLLFKCKTISYANQFTYYHRWNEGSITSTLTEKHVEGIFYAINDWLRLTKKEASYNELYPYLLYGISRTLDYFILRCIYKNTKTLTETLNKFILEIKKLDIILITDKHYGLKLIYSLSREKNINANKIEQAITQIIPQTSRIKYSPDSKLTHGLIPSEMAEELSNKIVFVCEVNYHVESAIIFCDFLAKNNFDCVILDNSNIVAGGKRKLNNINKNRNFKIIKTRSLPYAIDALCTASIVICYNDFNINNRDALEYRFLHKKPTACIVEGISDFNRVDFEQIRYLSYRRCEHVLLAGENDLPYFEDRSTYIIGMPNIEKLVKKQPVFPEKNLIVLNVNFTYGCLEDKRDFFASEAKEVFDDLGLDWIITKHPMDNGLFNGLNVSNKTQYELIDECSIFVSRFATGIIEALACGKPVIYFNPHNEKVDKFKEPLNAYYIANNKEELKEAIKRTQQEIEFGIDFRKKAENFLKKHASINIDDKSSAERLENAIIEIINKPL